MIVFSCKIFVIGAATLRTKPFINVLLESTVAAFRYIFSDKDFHILESRVFVYISSSTMALNNDIVWSHPGIYFSCGYPFQK